MMILAVGAAVVGGLCLLGLCASVIALQGAAGCRVTVYLKPTDEAQQAIGREYLGA